jgi:hypothetical protein
MKKGYIYFLVTLCIISNTTSGQVFTKLDVGDNIIAKGDGNLRLNALVSDGKIYYTGKIGMAAQAASLLCVVDYDGKNGKYFPQTYMIGANFIAATQQFIYYCSYVENNRMYDLYRFNKVTEKVEKIVQKENGSPLIYGIDAGAAFSKMYTYKDKLALVGFLYYGKDKKVVRLLSIIEDASSTPKVISD